MGAEFAYSADGGISWKLSAISPQPYFSAVSFTRNGVFALGTGVRPMLLSALFAGAKRMMKLDR